VTLFCENECTYDDGSPRLAEHGRYCTRCWRRLDMALTQAPDLAAHLVASVVPSAGADESGKVSASKDAPLPLNHAAFDDANELYSMLVYWSGVFAGHLQTQPPAPARAAWRTTTAKIVGLPADITPQDAGNLTGELARWIRNRLDTILTGVDWADDIAAFTDAIADVWRMNARWPRIDRPAFSRMPCPRDDCQARLAVYPPAFPGDARRIVCTSGHWYPEDEYEHLILVFEQTLREQKQVERTVRHLARKYGLA